MISNFSGSTEYWAVCTIEYRGKSKSFREKCFSTVTEQRCHPQCNIDIYQNDWKVLQQLREKVKYAVPYDSFNLAECFKLVTLLFLRKPDIISTILQKTSFNCFFRYEFVL